MPPEARELWDTFQSLSRSRRSGMSAQAFTLVDMQAWSALHGVRLTAWELDTLQLMDAAALAAVAQIRADDAAT